MTGWPARAWDVVKASPDSSLACVIAVVVSFLAALNVVDMDVVATAILATLAMLAFSLLRTKAAVDEVPVAVASLQRSVEARVNASADASFRRETRESTPLETARSVAMVQETGTLVTETARKQMVAILAGGGTVRAVVSAPNAETANLLAFRNANLQPDDILRRRDSFRAHLRDVVSQSGPGAGDRFTVRWLPYPVDTTYVLTDENDAEPARRRGVVRLAGFRVGYSDKLDFPIDAARSPVTFQHYRNEFDRLFLAAHKVVLIEGPPRIGKTTLLQGVVRALPAEHVFHVLTPAQVSTSATAAERQGFTVVTSDDPVGVQVAVRRGPRDYEVVGDGMVAAVRAASAAAKAGRVVILDEIGPLQMASTEIRELIGDLVDSPDVTLIASISEHDDQHHAKIKSSPRVSLIRLTAANRGTLHDELVREGEAAVRTVQLGLGSAT